MKEIKSHKKYRYKDEVYSGKTILLARKYRKRDGLSFSAALVKAEVTLERRAERELEERRDQIREHRAELKQLTIESQEKRLGAKNLADLHEIDWIVSEDFCLDCVPKRVELDSGWTAYYHSITCPTLLSEEACSDDSRKNNS